MRIPRSETEEVDSLREKWDELLELADRVREDLLKEKRNAFEQELDKQVKVGFLFRSHIPDVKNMENIVISFSLHSTYHNKTFRWRFFAFLSQ